MNFKKAAYAATVANALQILSALLVLALSLARPGVFTGRVEQAIIAVMSFIVIYGAVLDISDAFGACRLSEESQMLEEALSRLTELNGALRAQRHDFMNHLQVVYSLMELKDYDEAMSYIDKVYGDIQKLGSYLKTGVPAVNALLSAKGQDCRERGIEFILDMRSGLEGLPIEAWELCRVLGNLIDNAMDAVKGAPAPRVTVSARETLTEFRVGVSNNGPAIEPGLIERIFQQGFTTKTSGQGMGLFIVRGIARRAGGEIRVLCEKGETLFELVAPRKG